MKMNINMDGNDILSGTILFKFIMSTNQTILVAGNINRSTVIAPPDFFISSSVAWRLFRFENLPDRIFNHKPVQ